MSYILDALKKAEKERQLGKIPDIMTQQDTVIQTYKRGMTWHYFLIVLLIASSVLLWLVIGKTERETRESTLNMVSVPMMSEVINNKEFSQRSENKDTPISKDKIVHDSVEYKKRDMAKQIQGSSKIETDEKSPPPNLTQIEDKGRVSEHRIFNIRELPVDIQQSLPKLSMSVHIYNPEPASRLVKINGRTMKEGEELSSGLKLTEIIEDGAILSYHGYRFYVWME